MFFFLFFFFYLSLRWVSAQCGDKRKIEHFLKKKAVWGFCRNLLSIYSGDVVVEGGREPSCAIVRLFVMWTGTLVLLLAQVRQISLLMKVFVLVFFFFCHQMWTLGICCCVLGEAGWLHAAAYNSERVSSWVILKALDPFDGCKWPSAFTSYFQFFDRLHLQACSLEMPIFVKYCRIQNEYCWINWLFGLPVLKGIHS